MASHIVSKRTYLKVFAALLVLLVATVWVAFHDWGVLTPIVAMCIAVTKAALIVLYFMHVRYGNRLLWVFVGGGFAFVLILFVFTMSDVLTRHWLPTSTGW
jgi:cytochrome c oxidase subunit 4